MTMLRGVLRLRAIKDSDLRASPGKFRAVTIVDLKEFQIGEDVATLEEAKRVCKLEKLSDNQTFHIFDDKGDRHLP